VYSVDEDGGLRVFSRLCVDMYGTPIVIFAV